MSELAKAPGPVAKQWLQALLIIAAGWWVYWPALQGDWLRDDLYYLPENPLLSDPAVLWKLWFQPGSWIEYYPIEETVQWVQWQLWQNDTLGYHITNVVLHLINALLVWWLLGKFGLRLAWLGGLLFAIHPAQVESVAWIVELKNTLSLPPFLLAMGFYLDYEERGRRRDYLVALGLFLVAMLCKISMAPFPVVMLLYAWWKRDRISWKDVTASAPFFIISLVLVLATYLAGIWYRQSNSQLPDMVPMGGFLSRFACAGLTLSFYFWKVIWPVEMLPFYPKWPVDPPTLLQFLPWPVLAGIVCWFWSRRHGWGRHALLGTGFFVIHLMPFLGLEALAYFRFTWVMDHFLYIPIIGLIGLVIAALEQLERRLFVTLRRLGAGIIVGVMAFLVWESHVYAGMFINEETLWTYLLKHAPDYWVAHNNMGNILLQKGRDNEALEQFETARKLNPEMVEVPTNLGVALVMMGRFPEAIKQFQAASGIDPDYSAAHLNLGNILLQTGRFPEAAAEYEEVLRIAPRDSVARENMGLVLMKLGQPSEAREQFQAAADLDPRDADVQSNLGNALAQTGDPADAIDHFQEAVRIKPDDAEAHQNLGCALAQMGRVSEAIAQLQEALRLNPNYTLARANLARLEAQITNAAGKK